ncbi:hypothetical protein [Paenibacillus flagellatus]|uniref:Antibiotic biosynthesis monooxygenase n=1 Tax=Paenibacillus flagellatus TaxID=2211139 RepID=A0A2V5JZN0_9BACL|nr:hypothetical protein [Paenibacillus flagellatus]PYI50794.1 hypothetical protein DLM86_27375 [Paenibacillus flagellatus]
MDIVFVEYKVFPEKRDAYLRWIGAAARADNRFELYEGSEQPDLFVELWRGMDDERYRSFKRERLEPGDPSWGALAEFVPGGLAKVHVWHFRRTEPAG